MKKHLFPLIFIASLLLLFGCNKEATKVEEPEDIAEEVNEEHETKGAKSIDLNKRLGFTTEDVMDLGLFKNAESERLRIYNLDSGLKIESMRSEHAAVTFFVYYFDNNEYPSAFFIKHNGKDRDLNFEMLEVFYSKYSDEEIEVIEVLEDETEDYHLAGFIFNEEIHHSELPFSLSEITEDEFFVKGIEKDVFEKLNDSANYNELIKIVDRYIEENNVEDYDSVNDVMIALEPIREHLDKVEVKRDDFDNSATIYYNGLTDISPSNYVVPFIKTSERYMELLVGFEKDGWLFADKYTFNTDGELLLNSSLKFDRDTLGGKRIRESYAASYKEDVIESIINGTDIKLRFEGDKGNLDYTLTNEDKAAIRVINSFNEVHHNLSDLIYRFYR